MAAHRVRLSVVLAAVLLLGGCGGDIDKLHRLKAENARLRHALQTRQAERREEMRHWEWQASIAAGCDFLMPLCPESIVAPGRRALAVGYGGGTKFPFWAAFVGKLASLGAFASSLLSTLVWFWIRIGKPSAAAVDSADRLVREAERRAHAAKRFAAEAESRAARAEAAIGKAERELANLQEQIARTTERLVLQEMALEAAAAAQLALKKAFD